MVAYVRLLRSCYCQVAADSVTEVTAEVAGGSAVVVAVAAETAELNLQGRATADAAAAAATSVVTESEAVAQSGWAVMVVAIVAVAVLSVIGFAVSTAEGTVAIESAAVVSVRG